MVDENGAHIGGQGKWGNCGPSCPIETTCMTNSGAAANKPCIFPFSWRGITYNECTWVEYHNTEYKPWCSTMVDENGAHIGGQGKWGNCGPSCPIETTCMTNSGAAANKPCIFPFRWRGITYNECTWVEYHNTEYKPWCSTMVDENGAHIGGQGKWGNCGPSCPIE